MERVAASFREVDRRRVQRSVVEWSARTAGPRAQHSRMKQQRSRLMRAIRPREPMPEPVDPWQLGREALTQLGVVRLSLRDRHRALERIDAVEEIVRRLAWGPDVSSEREAS